jgi:hypothetical protein
MQTHTHDTYTCTHTHARRTGHNVEAAFVKTAEKIYDNIMRGIYDPNNDVRACGWVWVFVVVGVGGSVGGRPYTWLCVGMNALRTQVACRCVARATPHACVCVCACACACLQTHGIKVGMTGAGQGGGPAKAQGQGSGCC